MLRNLFLAFLFVLLAGTSGWLFFYLAVPKTASLEPGTASEQNYRIVSFDMPDEVFFANEKIPVELFITRESLERELIVNTYWHSSTLLHLKRANRWFPVIEPILAQYGVPDDFKYLSMIESGLTNAQSPAGAVGFWQFLKGTAKDYDLEINSDVDMRYHVELSTAAACRYLLKSYENYGSWSLVAASFNAGKRRIDNFLSDQKASSYFDLLMAEETERYLFRMIALKMIVENPERFGFFPETERLYPPLEFELVDITNDIDSWADYAREHNISYKLLKYFNPWLRSNKLKVKRGQIYTIKMPLPPFNLTHYELDRLYLQQ
ncbi:MAG: lytic transglycosylase domain-containing protein [Bacteroidetes bacterium]|jgi:membrane-bound lytic murein transglycosylase D|nr:lytic transglycosylase domain-containing protein [Bacteroidota bacterium]